MNKAKRVIEVLRVSTDAQDLQRQRADLERNKAAHHLTVARTVELEGISGRTVLSNRDVQRVLSDLKDSAISGVSISALDRLFRLDRYSDFSILDYFKDSGKLIYSTKEGLLDVRTDAGLIISLMSGAQSGLEWRELRRRTTQGKEVLRTAGGCPDGPLTLPRGVAYEPIKDATGRRTIGARWFYTSPDSERILLAYDLLFQRLSWRSIAERIGGGFTYHGVRSSLKNPLWMGVRRYSEGREEPLEIQVIDKPLISAARWQQAQEIILEKKLRWAKTKRTEPRYLLTGLLRCGCGAAVYIRCSSPSKPRSYYYCSTGFPGHGPKCGARAVQTEAADQVMERIASHQLLDAKFLKGVLGRFQNAQPARDQNAQKFAKERGKFEAQRQRLLRLTIEGTITTEDYQREAKRIEGELKDLHRLSPAPVPAPFDPAKLVVRITRTFARFHKQPLEERRDVLRLAFKEIIVMNGAVTSMVLNSGFCDDGANSLPRSLAWSTP
jgi:DNA invertase Pin-like site-specific DNA recombinase